MSSEMDRPELDDVLQWFMASADSPDWATLQRWMTRYPYYARELSEFAAAWTLSERLPANPETEALPLEHWSAIGRRAFERSVAESRAEYAQSKPLTSLAAAAKVRDLGVNQLAEQTGLSRTLLMKLDQRLIVAATIPTRLVRQIAEALNAPFEAVRAYLAQPATLAAGAQYKADETPSLQPQQTFEQAVRAEKKLEPAKRETLLAMALEDDSDRP